MFSRCARTGCLEATLGGQNTLGVSATRWVSLMHAGHGYSPPTHRVKNEQTPEQLDRDNAGICRADRVIHLLSDEGLICQNQRAETWRAPLIAQGLCGATEGQFFCADLEGQLCRGLAPCSPEAWLPVPIITTTYWTPSVGRKTG